MPNSINNRTAQNEGLVYVRAAPDALETQLLWDMSIVTGQRVRLDPDNQSVPTLARKLKQTNMPWMQHIESPGDEHGPHSVTSPINSETFSVRVMFTNNY
jgi:hypothetical protein